MEKLLKEHTLKSDKYNSNREVHTLLFYIQPFKYYIIRPQGMPLKQKVSEDLLSGKSDLIERETEEEK